MFRKQKEKEISFQDQGINKTSGQNEKWNQNMKSKRKEGSVPPPPAPSGGLPV
jgi:hypothetical protein